MRTALAALIAAALFLSLVMALAWLLQRRTGNSGWADAFWSYGTGMAGVGLALAPLSGGDIPMRQWLVATLAAVWSLRLGTHIALRSLNGVEDARYARLREEWGADFQPRLFRFLQVQAAASLLLVLSIAVAAHNPAPGLRLADMLGVLVMVIAIAGEGLADHQLRTYKARQVNGGGLCDTGLWAWSRHPNYFFEWLGWLAYPLIAIDVTGAYPWGFLSVTGPAFIYWLLVHVSGIPLVEQHMMRSRPDAFRAYAERTSAFWPRPPKPLTD